MIPPLRFAVPVSYGAQLHERGAIATEGSPRIHRVHRVLIPDGDERSALAAARSLRADGDEVHVAGPGRLTLTSLARGVVHHRLHSSPARRPRDFALEIAHLLRQRHIDLLLPVTDASVTALLAHRELLPAEVRLPFPERERWLLGTDKGSVLTAAVRAGFSAPPTDLLQDADDLARVREHLTFPLFAKPHRSLVRRGSGAVKLEVTRVADQAALERRVRALPEEAFPLLLQRPIEGPGEGIFLLRWNGVILAAFAHRRLREKPPSGGVSVLRESIPLSPDLERAGTRLLDALDWQGVAMIECRRDLDTGRHVIMEINGRLWGSLQLAIDAGVDFPRLLVRAAMGERVVPVKSYTTGVRSRWWWGDVDHLYLRLKQGIHRWGALRDFFAPASARTREEIWRWDDPGPFIAETLRRSGLRW